MDSRSETHIDLNKTPVQLEAHRNLLHPTTAPVPNNINVIPIIPQPFGCTACNRTFPNYYALAGHYNAHRGTRFSTRMIAAAKKRARAEKAARFKLPVAAPPLTNRPLIITHMSSASYRLGIEKQLRQAAERVKLMGAFKPLAILNDDADTDNSPTPLATFFGAVPPRKPNVGGAIRRVPPHLRAFN